MYDSIGFTSVHSPDITGATAALAVYDSNYVLILPISRLDPINRIRVARLSRIRTTAQEGYIGAICDLNHIFAALAGLSFKFGLAMLCFESAIAYIFTRYRMYVVIDTL
jgi:choline-glycine betaine transporter